MAGCEDAAAAGVRAFLVEPGEQETFGAPAHRERRGDDLARIVGMIAAGRGGCRTAARREHGEGQEADRGGKGAHASGRVLGFPHPVNQP